MKSTLALAASALLVSVASANYTFDASEVDSATRLTWCQAELESCPKICIEGAKTNTCDETDLTYDCTCDNGTSIDVSAYTNTLPYFICEQTYIQCIAANPNDADAQEACTEQKDDDCGTIDPDNITSTTTTSSSAAATTAAATSTAASAASTTAAASASATAASMGIKVGQNYGFAILAGVFAVASRLLL